MDVNAHEKSWKTTLIVLLQSQHFEEQVSFCTRMSAIIPERSDLLAVVGLRQQCNHMNSADWIKHFHM